MDSADKSQWKQVAIALVLAFGFALMVNWSILKLFDQKSADRAEHSLVGIILLMAYIALLAEKKANHRRAVGVFVLALIPCYFGTVFPDLDIRLFGIGGHRNPLFHSSLSVFILCFLVRRKPAFLQTLVAGYGVGLASHLWWDVLYYGDVRWLPGGVIDRLWLGAHGVLCVFASGRAIRRVTGSEP
ncbi:hypothetical protein NKDENANG_01918 [Candidatus Entotheonellaceae bacterium PAL068K]